MKIPYIDECFQENINEIINQKDLSKSNYTVSLMMQSYLNVTEKFVVVGDKVLIKPRELDSRTESGLFLPPGVHKKDKIQSGYIIKTGPGYATATGLESDEPWKQQAEKVKYIPLQCQEGDLAIFLQDHAYEIQFEKETYLIVPQSAILMLIRDRI